MVTRRGGYRRKSRHKMSKPRRQKGKISLTNMLQEFKDNDKVVLKMEPGYQKGNYHLRFYGSAGTVIGKRGNCYKVKIKHMNAERTVIVHPVHLKKV